MGKPEEVCSVRVDGVSLPSTPLKEKWEYTPHGESLIPQLTIK